MTIQAPMSDYSGGGNPGGQVNGPGIFLLIVGVLNALAGIVMLLVHLLGVGLGAASGADFAVYFNGGMGIVIDILGILFGAVIIFGAMKMRSLQGYGIAMTAAVLAMLPCTYCCCPAGLAAGIWALVVLMKPEVKAAYR